MDNAFYSLDKLTLLIGGYIQFLKGWGLRTTQVCTFSDQENVEDSKMAKMTLS